jgi:hypothetical protein
MRHEADELWCGDTYMGRWKVISRPGAIIQAKMLEMSDETRRSLTAEGVTSLPAPRLDRYRKFWNLPKAG